MKRLKQAFVVIFIAFIVIIGGWTVRKVYKYYHYRLLVERCDDIFLMANDEEFVIHPFVSDKELTAVIPSYWTIDSVKMYYKGNLLNSSIIHDQRLISGKYEITIYQSKLSSVQINTISGNMEEINASLDKSVSESGTIKVVNNEGFTEYDGELKKIKGRGNGTWRQNLKKPYNITFPHATQILGLKKAKKFCLLANDKDNTHLKNWLALNIAKELGAEYPVDCEHAAVWFNGRYAGLYLVTNKVDVSKSSVDICDLEEATEYENGRKLSKYSFFNTGGDYTDSWDCFPQKGGTMKGIDGADNPEDISGGYLLDHAARLFTYAKSKSGFVTDNNWTVSIKSPEYATREQVDYIREKYALMDAAISSENGYDLRGHYYTDYIDLHSFVTYYLCQEVLMNHDGGIGSVTIFKPEDSMSKKFYAGPVWDFDVAFNYGAIDVGRIPQAYIIKDGLMSCPNGYRGLLGEVAKHEDFMDSVKMCYANQMRPIIEKYLFSTILKDKRTEISEDVRYNALLWGRDLEAFNGECDELESFMRERISFLDDEWINNVFRYTVTLDVGWREHPLPYHKLSLRVKEGEKVPNFPSMVRSYYFDEENYKGLGWYVVGTDCLFDQTQPINNDINLEYRWIHR